MFDYCWDGLATVKQCCSIACSHNNSLWSIFLKSAFFSPLVGFWGLWKPKFWKILIWPFLPQTLALYFQTGSDVCQLRLDFESFTLTSPTTRVTGAAPANAVAGDYTAIPFGNCETDFFSVSVPGATGNYFLCTLE